jgi:predicted CDP-diglyceride synthetase/phosphatidate cytidylyltransferase
MPYSQDFSPTSGFAFLFAVLTSPFPVLELLFFVLVSALPSSSRQPCPRLPLPPLSRQSRPRLVTLCLFLPVLYLRLCIPCLALCTIYKKFYSFLSFFLYGLLVHKVQ